MVLDLELRPPLSGHARIQIANALTQSAAIPYWEFQADAVL